MRIRTHSRAASAATAAGLLGIVLAAAAPVASAATTPAASGPLATQPATMTFVPPRVGAISVDIAPTILNGVMTDPGLHVLMPAVTLPPISFTLPRTGSTR